MQFKRYDSVFSICFHKVCQHKDFYKKHRTLYRHSLPFLCRLIFLQKFCTLFTFTKYSWIVTTMCPRVVFAVTDVWAYNGNDILQDAIKDCNKVLLSFIILFAIMVRAVDIYIFCQNEGTLSIARLICNMLM